MWVLRVVGDDRSSPTSQDPSPAPSRRDLCTEAANLDPTARAFQTREELMLPINVSHHAASHRRASLRGERSETTTRAASRNGRVNRCSIVVDEEQQLVAVASKLMGRGTSPERSTAV